MSERPRLTKLSHHDSWFQNSWFQKRVRVTSVVQKSKNPHRGAGRGINLIANSPRDPTVPSN
jgi:hypothetical protein